MNRTKQNNDNLFISKLLRRVLLLLFGQNKVVYWIMGDLSMKNGFTSFGLSNYLFNVYESITDIDTSMVNIYLHESAKKTILEKCLYLYSSCSVWLPLGEPVPVNG